MLSGIMFGLVPIAVKYVTGIFRCPIYAGLFYRYFTGTLFLSVPGLRELKKTSLDPGMVRRILVSSLLVNLTALSLYSAYSHIAVGIATTIHYAYPLLVVLGSCLLFREPLKRGILSAILLSFLGLALLSNPFQAGTLRLPGILLALLSALCYSLYLLMIGRQSLGEMPPAAFSLLLNGFGTVFILLFNLAQGSNPLAEFGRMLPAFLPAGVFSMLAYLMLFSAVQRIGAVKVSIFSTLEPVASLIGGALILHEHMAVSAVVGCVLVLAAAVLVQREPGGSKSP